MATRRQLAVQLGVQDGSALPTQGLVSGAWGRRGPAGSHRTVPAARIPQTAGLSRGPRWTAHAGLTGAPRTRALPWGGSKAASGHRTGLVPRAPTSLQASLHGVQKEGQSVTSESRTALGTWASPRKNLSF